ncbi:PadR family transcriptional regulator [Pseudarthrobacter sp. J75]|uniref:PadR family transcriptional regulator n=1 Tax=unclassified Pseudarthrobacter TaxID=2647000 RepID=UPI002E800D9D|nr:MULTISPECIES: PadR family transcriptional regulator [unclassified Pseudarthrobacter]MEE2522474.1 PadR family transcriptional regulator [Pseudarthrobacter sp. J47]MEE2529195.1 PadR family transcriptional regulator [Pseudarthrobacter sp. J75]MEE2570482.1 PadR family transcriptional regulator [Pseudarthrobacter sp. J64]
MSIRHSLLALLQDQPRYGYQLRVEFESRTGATWPLNIGQVYTTLDRLERDGLVQNNGDDGEGHVIYSITKAGTEEVRSWFDAPVERNNPPRNELAIKLALAVTLPGVDVAAIIQAQRVASIRALQDYTKARRDTAANQRSADTAWLLVLDSLIFQTEAEVRWLDLCEARMVQQAQAAKNQGSRQQSAGVTSEEVRHAEARR